MRVSALCLLALACFFSTACGTGSNCPENIPLVITPANATADHTLSPPGNQIQFTANAPTAGQGCKQEIAIISAPQWRSSDSTDVQFSPTVNGLATCVNATSSPSTISAQQVLGVQQANGTAQLTCK